MSLLDKKGNSQKTLQTSSGMIKYYLRIFNHSTGFKVFWELPFLSSKLIFDQPIMHNGNKI